MESQAVFQAKPKCFYWIAPQCEDEVLRDAWLKTITDQIKELRDIGLRLENPHWTWLIKWPKRQLLSHFHHFRITNFTTFSGLALSRKMFNIDCLYRRPVSEFGHDVPGRVEHFTALIVGRRREMLCRNYCLNEKQKYIYFPKYHHVRLSMWSKI